MLSTGKLAAGNHGYYLEQVADPVTGTTAVTTGVEDYYLGGAEAPGRWIGSGCPDLALAGTVHEAQLRHVLSGQHPESGDPLGRVIKNRRPGFDCTFSAPKSVSVLFGLGDARLREVIVRAHEHAVDEALGYLERAAAVTRRGPGGAQTIAGNGFVAAAFRHRTSRAGDPQLHTHVLVANLIRGEDGRWSTLDGRRLYQHNKAAGYLYEARLRALLTRELGVEWTLVRNGIADIDGVPKAVMRAFSRRRAEIESELERLGLSSAAAAQVATLSTRRAKDYRVTPERLAVEWAARAAELGFARRDVADVLDRATPDRPDPATLDRIAAVIGGPDGLTQAKSSFTRRDVVQELCDRLPGGAELTVREIEALADRFLASDRAVELDPNGRAEPLVTADRGVVPTVPADPTYSTPELLGLEQQIIDYALRGTDARRALALPARVERAITARPTLAAEQEEMIRRLASDGSAIAVVVGQAGTGKTFALAAAREAWEQSGYRVRGAAIARRAGRELEAGAGIPSASVTELLNELSRWPATTLRRRSVLVLDEAGMIPTRTLAQLMQHADRLELKLVLVGDHHQLPAIGAGGAFRGLVDRLPVIELRENRRQLEAWEREALGDLRAGDAPAAVGRYESARRVTVAENAEDVRRALVTDWWKAADLDGAVMLAQRRVDVADLNGRAHAMLRAAGALGEDELLVGGVGMAAGDWVLVRRNDRARGVVNGERGVIVAVDRAQGHLELDVGGRRVVLDREFLAGPTRSGGASLTYGYAMTAHLAQGMTCRQTFVLVSDSMSREGGYVALSRGRVANHLYVVASEPSERDEYAPASRDIPDPHTALVERLSRSQVQTLAVDTGAPRPRVVERPMTERRAGRSLFESREHGRELG